MPNYAYPEMPVRAVVTYRADTIPPSSGGDDQVFISLSPVRPEDWIRATSPQAQLPVTHIIRTAPDRNVGDNYEPGAPGALFPCTVYEVPESSGHYYVVLWYHEVGLGFPNHHARIYVCRLADPAFGELPIYVGWP